MVIFLHIPRTAGTTLDRILRRQYRADQIFLVDSNRTEESLHELALRVGSGERDVQLVMGHVPYGIHELFPREASYFTIVRDPVARVLSLYRFMVEEPEPRLREAVHRGISLAEFVTSGISIEPDNGQTRALVGDTLTPFGRCSPDMLDRARTNLERLQVVGLTERFDETLILLRHSFGWKRLLYSRLNVTGNALRRGVASREDLDLIAARNAFDIELYRHATDLFARQVAAIGPAFRRDLGRLKRANALYRPWAALTYGVPRSLYHRVRARRNRRRIAWVDSGP